MRNPTTAESIARRLSEKTDRSAGPLACHPWTGNFGQFGSPVLPIQRPGGVKGGGSARRLVWEAIHGPLEKTRRVRVTCGNLSCMNLAHMTLEPVKDPVPRFWKNVNKLPGEGCWEWMATRTHVGKGKGRKGRRGAGYGGFMHPWTKRVAAHRFSWELHNGPIPEGMIVMHICDNPPCVRPDHLKLGTLKENSQDAIAKGRNSRGAEHAARCAAGRLARAAETGSAGAVPK